MRLDAALIIDSDRERVMLRLSRARSQMTSKARYGYTAMLLLTAGTYVWGNIVPGARVDVLLTLAGEKVALPALSHFGLITGRGHVERTSVSARVRHRHHVGHVAVHQAHDDGLMLVAATQAFPVASSDLMVRVLDASGKWCIVDTQSECSATLKPAATAAEGESVACEGSAVRRCGARRGAELRGFGLTCGRPSGRS